MKHPSDNPNLPSFTEDSYRQVAPDLELVLACWNDLKDAKPLYLPQEDAEPSRAYKARLERTRFDNRFEPAIRSQSGLLSNFSLTESAPQTLRDSAQNIDLRGNDIESFWQQLDEVCLRDGGVGVLVEYPTEDEAIENNAELMASGRRPYLVAIDRRNILNWQIGFIDGLQVLERVTIREYQRVPDGAFGSKIAPVYRVLTPGYWAVYQIDETPTGMAAVVREQGETGLNQIPLVWYSSTTSTDWFEGKPPFLNLAELNIEHFQKRSGLNEVLHKCNLPVPVRKGVIRSIQDLLKPVLRLVIGPNSVVDIPPDGDFYFAEPTGNAIAATQADIAALEAAMDRVSLAFLTGGEAQKTATEVLIDSAQIQCSVRSFARRKENAFWKVAELWAGYTGEPSPEGAGMDVRESILQPQPNPQDIQMILDNMGVRFSNKLGLQMLIDRGWLPPDTEIDGELELLEAAESTVLFGGDNGRTANDQTQGQSAATGRPASDRPNLGSGSGDSNFDEF